MCQKMKIISKIIFPFFFTQEDILQKIKIQQQYDEYIKKGKKLNEKQEFQPVQRRK